MQRHHWLPVSLTLVLAATFSNGQEKGAKTPNYYPLAIGNEWHLRVTADNTLINQIATIAKIETIDGVPLARLETTVKDKIVYTEHLRQTAEGAFRHRDQGAELVPPFCLLKYPIKSGDKWDGYLARGKDKAKYFAEAKEETVKVPAGKFKTMRVAIRIDSSAYVTNIVYWFAADVGFVKQTYQSGKRNVVVELEKFVGAKDEKK